MGTTNKNSCKTAAVMSLLGKGSGSGAIVPNLGTIGGREQIEYIDIDRIDDDPNNFYELSALDELAANIELLGLQQPIRVRPGAERGRYVIVSGHRRRAAVRLLVAEGHGELRDLPCIVEREQASAALQELRLIYANSDTRRLTSAELGRQAERVEALLYQLREEGYEFPGRMRDHVAEACKASKSKLARLKVIRENLAAPWRPAYEAGNLSESTAHTLAQMPPERQQVIFDGLAKRGDNPGSVQESVVRDYGKSLAQVERIECRTYGSGPCLNRETMRAKVMTLNSWSYNSCRQCCEQCLELTHCKYACSMLADYVKRIKADAKGRREQELKAREEADQPQVDAIKALWVRFGAARAAAGKTVRESCETMKVYYAPKADGKYEGLESLKAKIDASSDVPYGNSYCFDVIQRCVRAADLFGVSLDYLLCRTDDPAGPTSQPEGQLVFNGWMPGGTTPQHPCDVAADFEMGDGEITRMLCEFDKGCFRYFNTGSAIKTEPVRWLALPPVEE